jgi:hypothetical protein
MSRALLILSNDAMRARAINWIAKAEVGTQVEFREAKRSTEQNSKLWACLTEIARQRPIHNGVKMTPDLFKAVFMQALGREMVMLPTLNGDGFFPIGHRSSELSKAEFSDLLELIHAWAATQGITLNDPSDGSASDRVTDGPEPSTGRLGHKSNTEPTREPGMAGG